MKGYERYSVTAAYWPQWWDLGAFFFYDLDAPVKEEGGAMHVGRFHSSAIGRGDVTVPDGQNGVEGCAAMVKARGNFVTDGRKWFDGFDEIKVQGPRTSPFPFRLRTGRFTLRSDQPTKS